jgi:hypothetical protein
VTNEKKARSFVLASARHFSFLSRLALIFSSNRGFQEGQPARFAVEPHPDAQGQCQILRAMPGCNAKQYWALERGGLLCNKLDNARALGFTLANWAQAAKNYTGHAF